MKKIESKIGKCEYHLCGKRTKVFLCRYCGKYFCKQHIKPKPVLTWRQVFTTKEPIRSKLEEIWRSKEGHPDYIFTQIFWKRLEEEEKIKLKRMWEALDKLKEMQRPAEEKIEKEILSRFKGIPSKRKYTKAPEQREKVITIPLELAILFIVSLVFVWYFFTPQQTVFKTQTTTTTFLEETTTTTLKEAEQYFVDLNFSTPAPRLNKTSFITNSYSVYINDSLLKIIDPNLTSFYNESIQAIKKAFKIWEEETNLLKFKFVGPEENHTLYLEITAEMPIKVKEKEFVSYAVGYAIPYGYQCGNYNFIKGGKIYLSLQKADKLLKIALHEIGHILNLADVGNKDSIMYQWSEEEVFPEEVLRGMITPEIKETLRMIVKPEYDCKER